MSSAKYTRLPTIEKFDHDQDSSSFNYPPSPSSSHASTSSSSSIETDHNRDIEGRPRRRRQEPLPAFDSDPRFRVDKPSPWARGALIAFMLFMFYLAFRMRKALWVVLLESDGVNETDPDTWGM